MWATGEAGRRGAGDAGTTLVEALVVVALTAAIAELAFPALSGAIRSTAFTEAAVGLRADLHMARAQALSTDQRVELVVQPGGRGYGWSPGPQRALLGGLSLAPVGPAATFYPDGSASAATLALGNGRSSVRFVVDATTGAAGAVP